MYDILIYLPVIKENLTDVMLKYYIKYMIYERNGCFRFRKKRAYIERSWFLQLGEDLISADRKCSYFFKIRM
jgi:hypothetical protein